MNFTDYIAGYIQENELDLTKLTIVLPSERMKKYVCASIVKQYGKPVFAPVMITMDQWVKSHSKDTVIDKTRALIRLYEIHLTQTNGDADLSFDEFMTWGNILLADFNEIDRYLLDPKHVFKNLADIKEIEQWSFNSTELTRNQKRFMDFWDRLPVYYYELNKVLEENNQCYNGKAYRELVNNIGYLFNSDPDQHYLFAGFNALSPCEISLMKQLLRMQRGHVLVDADRFYFSENHHEAGRFLRELRTELELKEFHRISDKLSTKPMNIEVIECAQNTGQVKVSSTILQNSTPEELNNTLLLLADETLIGAVIKNLPGNIDKANITLGLPIRNTAIRTWVDLLFNIQENKTRFKTESIYFSDLQQFWNHPFTISILDEKEREILYKAEQTIIKRNNIFISKDKFSVESELNKIELGEKTIDLVRLIFNNWNEDWSVGMHTIRELNRYIYRNLNEGYAFEKAIIECFDQSLIEFVNIIEEGLPSMRLRSFRQLFNQHWVMKSIAYHGNPTEGLQIMGLLESRGLDFKRIICVGMNEGNLPPTNPVQTLIPMDLRKYLNLPTPREKQGLFAHHFYRLLHSCEDLFITYSSASEAIGSNEKSRYVMQLELELSRINPNVRVRNRVYSLTEDRVRKQNSIDKTTDIIKRLDELLSLSTSASMLKKYLDCPLDFYYRYVMDFGEEESIEEEIEQSTFGTFVHKTLEILYEPFARLDSQGNEKSQPHRNITSPDIEYMLKNFDPILLQQFLKHFNNDREAFEKGKNFLSYKMAGELIRRYLKSEIAFLSDTKEPVFIEALEYKFEREIELEISGELKTIKLRGTIDRIDRIGETHRIIDYKTGKVEQKDVKFRDKDVDIETYTESMGSLKHILQLTMYAWAYKQLTERDAQCGIISFISSPKGELFGLVHNKKDILEVRDAFPECLKMILEEMYDAEIPFIHNSENSFLNYCTYC